MATDGSKERPSAIISRLSLNKKEKEQLTKAANYFDERLDDIVERIDALGHALNKIATDYETTDSKIDSLDSAIDDIKALLEK